ncbi:MAG TPA: tRNA (adenosine(37)-N6)-threonylcarbamoyltransferase complex dimerization subunit type 1 TsaB [Candidatus Latescibacteria bacterium]|nr:tRNA (adenosine(37)-N6)-threonylcarbamoyltransferase complex dimerization subunit type 1 TsaB [Candidatus Latescibacterota bacterium]
MRVLGIETTTMTGSVAVVTDSVVAASYLWNVRSVHSERLMVAIERVLSDASIELGGLDGVAVSIGPGSFTGLRIGLSTAKGLCLAAELSLVPVPTLDALASRLLFCTHQVCPMLDARKKQVYACLYDVQNGETRRLSEPVAISPVALLKGISRTTVFLGNGASLYREQIVKALGERASFAPAELNHPDAATVARLGISRLQRGEKVDPESLEPMYLRGPDVGKDRSKTGQHNL